MKFLFLSSHAHLALDPEADRVSGGAELQVALLARELARRGQAVVIAAGDTGQGDGLVLDGVRIRNAGRFQTGGLVDTVAALPKVARIIRAERPDYTFILGWTTWLFVLDVMRPLGVGRLGFICGLDTEVNGRFRAENPVRGALFEHAMRRCDVRFAMSEHQAGLFARRGMRCGLYRNLVLDRRNPRNAAKPVDLLWIARCQAIKRPHLFLDLVEALPECRCRMVCPREDEALWDAVAARARALPNLSFSERVPYHEVQREYDAAKVFVNTSSFEGWPNSFIQAGQGGVALLSLDINPDGLFERYRLGEFAAGDVGRLETGARRMLSDQGALDAMQRECERFVGELHDNARNVDAFLDGLPRLRGGAEQACNLGRFG